MKDIYFKLFIMLSFFLTETAVNAMPAQILIVRHGEKRGDGSKNLSMPRGYERAAALPYFFADYISNHNFSKPPAFPVGAVYSSHDNSSRPLETCEPFVFFLNKNPSFSAFSNMTNNSFYGISDYTEAKNGKNIADEIIKNPELNNKTVVLCWEHRNIPGLTMAFVNSIEKSMNKKFKNLVPKTWEKSVFDQMWVLTPDNVKKELKFEVVNQRLLFGDK